MDDTRREDRARARAEVAAAVERLRPLLRALPKSGNRTWALRNLNNAKCLALRALEDRG